ncbi:MAG TPA: DinB family protein [Ktedonobacterales bacterium]|nr:DinB family protein [Ktedonobacterales bacterium]
METADLKARLVALLHEGSDLQRAFVAVLSAGERDATGTPERWSAKDLVAHLTSWKARRLRQLDAVLGGEEPPRFDLDETNAQTWDEQQRRAWDDILADEARVAQEMAARVERMSVADLTAMDRYPLPLQPAALQLVRPGYTHIVGHLAEHYIERGEMERAIALRQAAAVALDAFPEFPAMASAPRYNLACSYAVTGQQELAIAELGRVLALNPALIEYARSDADLASLRGSAEYQALIAGA